MTQITVPLADDHLIVREDVRTVPRTDPDTRALRLGPPERPAGSARTAEVEAGAEWVVQTRGGVVPGRGAGTREWAPARPVGRAP